MTRFITPTINTFLGGILGIAIGRTLPWLFDGLFIGLLFGGIVELIFSRINRRRIWFIIGFEMIFLLIFVAPVFSIQSYLQPKPGLLCCETPADAGLAYENVTFNGADGVQLAGWYIPSRNGAAVILLHGDGGNRRGVLYHAEALGQAGYGILMYDQRALGESGGDTRSWGWLDIDDVPYALEFLIAHPEVNPERIGILGVSLGGQIAIRAAAADPRIKAVIADGPSMSSYEDLPAPRNPADAVENFFMWVADRGFEAHLGMSAPSPIIDIIGTVAPRPLLLITGLRDSSEARRIYKYYDYAGLNAFIWGIAEGVHADGPYLRPEEYAARITAFFDAALLR